MEDEDFARGRRLFEAWALPTSAISDIMVDAEEDMLEWLREHGDALFARAAEPKLRVRRMERVPFEIEEE